MLKIAFAAATLPGQHALIVTVADKNMLGEQGQKLDKKTNGALSRAMAASHFTGAAAQTLTVLAPAGTRLSRVILVGIGAAAKADAALFARVGGAGVAALTGKDAQAMFLVDQHKDLALPAGEAAAQTAYGARLRSYRFDKYHTKLKAEQKPALKSLIVATRDAAAAKADYAPLGKIADGVFLARDLVTEPGNVIYPETLAQAARGLAELGVKVEVLDEKQMKKLGMGALLGVAQGSAFPPRLVAMSWMGDADAKDKRPVCFVGKGVTFDTGGISIKPAGGMEDMKYDMGGSAAVIGAMKALAGRKAKANVVGIVGTVENMPSGTAQRPGDVVTTMSGQTVEVINTDAEGRLVLADAMWYAQETFKPRCVIDLATLTGAIRIALGSEYAGLFSNDDTLSAQLTAAGKMAEEPLWRMPMGDAYDKQINSAIADMKNIGDGGAGSITAAQFLQRFIKKGTPWAHLDIASMAWATKDKPLSPKGATAFGVRLLDRFVAA
ncbi:MAG: leucyl aminopeptidase, partial [Alphaproteobacteria bacterium]|nr:leucyl aminopeptidase [Alphaproteobacteria bacterium]